MSTLYQHIRERDVPHGPQNSPCTLSLQLLLATYATAQQDPYSIRVGSEHLPDGDFHPAIDAKLRSAR